MPQIVSIPRRYMGTVLQESTVKGVLRVLQPDLHFDLGGRHNLWHPYQQTRQAVFYKGKHICSMDRGTIPEIPVWSLTWDWIEVPARSGLDGDYVYTNDAWRPVLENELVLFMSCGVICRCLWCQQDIELLHRPRAVISCCREGCSNVGPSLDVERWHWRNKPDGRALIKVQVRDRIILVGWRHTFAKLIRANIPGITQHDLEGHFGVDLSPRIVDAHEVDEADERDFLDQKVEVG